MSAEDSVTLRYVLADAEALLLDFDGPICSVFSGFPASEVAEQLRNILAEGGHNGLPYDVQVTGDPFDIFSFAATIGENEARYTEAALRAHEVEAIANAEPTPGSHDLIRTWHASGRKLAIVSNNSAAAVDAYLHLHGLASCVNFVSARTESDPALLKPRPFLLRQATEALRVASTDCVLIGDSLTDIQAARAAVMPVIGYANKPGKVELFAKMDPQAIVTRMSFVTSAAQGLLIGE